MSLKNELIEDISDVDLLTLSINKSTKTRELKKYLKLVDMRIMDLVLSDEKLGLMINKIFEALNLSPEVISYIKNKGLTTIKKQLYQCNNSVLSTKFRPKIESLIEDCQTNPNNKPKNYIKVRKLIYLQGKKGDEYAIDGGIYNPIRELTYVCYGVIRKLRINDNDEEEDYYTGGFDDDLDEKCNEDYKKVFDIYLEYLLENYPDLV